MAHPKYKTKRPRPVELKTVPAGRSRQRLLLLSRAGIGRKAVHEVTGLDEKTLSCIKNGKTRYVRRATRDLIFSVPFDAHCDYALIDPKRTREMIDELIHTEDFTKSEIARRLGSKQKRTHPTLGLARKGKVLARSQMRVEKLYRDAVAA